MKDHWIGGMLAVALLVAGRADRAQASYDPLALPPNAKPVVLDLMVPGEPGGRGLLRHRY